MLFDDFQVEVSTGHSRPYLVLTAVTASVVPVLLYDVTATLFPALIPSARSVWWRVVLEFVLLVVPLELLCSRYSPYALEFAGVIVCIILLVITAAGVRRRRGKREQFLLKVSDVRRSATWSSWWHVELGPRQTSVTYYRAYVLLFTSFAILAVDFPVLPWYFFKSESYGLGLMDVGIGCFVVGNAIVSVEARGTAGTDSFLGCVVKALRSSALLVLLGIMRFVVMETTGHAVKVTEYGIHWNFFFSLAAVQITSKLVLHLTPRKLHDVIGVALILCHQFMLTSAGLSEFVLYNSGRGQRSNLLEANKEGLISSVGLLALYLAGVPIGRLLFTVDHRGRLKDRLFVMGSVVMVTAVCWLLLMYTDVYIEGVSRRLANLSYFLFMIVFTGVQLALGLTFDLLVAGLAYYWQQGYETELGVAEQQHGELATCKRRHDNQDSSIIHMDKVVNGSGRCHGDQTSSLLLQAINYNGLVYFLFANIFTGIIGFSFQTRSANQSTSFLVISLYMLLLAIVTVKLYQMKFKLYHIPIIQYIVGNKR